eukprot:COSAG06_NODE_46808_length_344_cov_0.632653_1_plen_25_part_10
MFTDAFDTRLKRRGICGRMRSCAAG